MTYAKGILIQIAAIPAITKAPPTEARISLRPIELRDGTKSKASAVKRGATKPNIPNPIVSMQAVKFKISIIYWLKNYI
jgi:hypothetical protein